MKSNKLNTFKKEISKKNYFNLFKLKTNYPGSKFVIYTRGRTGSTVLTELLNCHPEIFCDVEIFSFLYSGTKIKFPELYIKSCSKRATIYGKSVYGFKVKIAQLRDEHGYKNYDRILKSLFNNGYKFIYLERENFLRHKLSNIVASQTKIFHIKSGEKSSTENLKIKVDCDQLMEGIKFGEEVNLTERKNLEGIDYLTLSYEKDLAENSYHQNTADKVFKYLGLKPVKAKTDLQKIVPDNLSATIENMDEVYNYFKNTEYLNFLK